MEVGSCTRENLMYIRSIAYTTKENLNIIVSQAVSSKMLQTSKQTKLRNKQLFKQTTKLLRPSTNF